MKLQCWCSLALFSAVVSASTTSTVVVFPAREGNFTAFINPSLVVLTPGAATAGGSLLVFVEARLAQAGDGDPSRIGVKRSDDGGRTWGGTRALLPEGVDPGSTLGNLAAFVVPSPSGLASSSSLSTPSPHERIQLVFCINNTIVCSISSDDGGESWSPIVNITASAKEAGEGWVATGPANAAVLRSGGRVLVPINTNVARGSITIDYDLVPGSQGRNRECPMESLLVGVRGEKPSPLPPLHYLGGGNVDPKSVTPGKRLPAIDACSTLTLANVFKLQQRAFALISDDAGKSWRRSSALPLLASETGMADMGGGRVLARSRLAEAGWQDGCHHFASSGDGGDTWEAVNTTQCLSDPGVQAALLGLPGGDVLMASPIIEERCGDHLRGNLTLYRSGDRGATWAVAAVVHADCSGYSSMVAMPSGSAVGVVWSTNGLPRGGPVLFRTIDLG